MVTKSREFCKKRYFSTFLAQGFFRLNLYFYLHFYKNFIKKLEKVYINGSEGKNL